MELFSDSALLAAADSAVTARRGDPNYQQWSRDLGAHLEAIQSADREAFGSTDFQKDLWESQAVTSTGQGKVSTSGLWSDERVIDLLWRVRNAAGEGHGEKMTAQLESLWEEAEALSGSICGRVPRLKMARVFAALQPEQFSTLADSRALFRLGKLMGLVNGKVSIVRLHRRILDRLQLVVSNLDPSDGQSRALLKMTLAWLIFAATTKSVAPGITLEGGDSPGEVRLKPLPAERRRRGMLAIAGSVASVLAMLQFVADGCTRQDLRDHVVSINPNLKPESAGTNINALVAEWGALTITGDIVTLTPRGMAFLESGDVEEVSDWLLTQILGFDNALEILRNGEVAQKKMIVELQKVNPGWTANFGPTVLINWLRGMDLANLSSNRILSLTDKGKEWAERIDWVPGRLPRQVDMGDGETGAISELRQALNRPKVKDIHTAFPAEIAFDLSLIAHLDAALWSHPRRHFVVLTGLSGSGKTQLAINYARALWQADETQGDVGLLVLPVQPGWHDPTALLGYVNPLNNDQYMRTGFLTFLMDAVRDPDRVYTVVLDEMNLSHPEQYFAPLLSAMETGAHIELHSHADNVDEVPAKIPYPSNLLVIGTVNMDETTHGLSDKLLDRATVIEFWDIDTDAYSGWGSAGLSDSDVTRTKLLLKQLSTALSPARLHFGWRTVSDILGFVRAALGGGEATIQQALDLAVSSKILPKLRGDDTPRVRAALAMASQTLSDHGLALSRQKVSQLIDDLDLTGSARYWR